VLALIVQWLFDAVERFAFPRAPDGRRGTARAETIAG
jgi:hypothetical protein